MLLSAVSIYVGYQNTLLQLREHTAIAEHNRSSLQVRLDKDDLHGLRHQGYNWNRRPQVLSPIVYGLSGTLGQEIQLKYFWPLYFEGSLFATDPVHTLFGVLDLAFIVKIILSLCVLLFTYDAVCGEKEGGTLRLYASFPVSRSKLALAKLVGSTVAILVPFVFAYLLASAVLSLSPEIGLQGEDWVRVAILMVLFALYLTVFAAFGLLASSLTHRRMVAFLGLLGLWTIWIFLLPEVSLRLSRSLAPIQSIYSIERQSSALRWEIRESKATEKGEYWEGIQVNDWDALSEARQQEILAGVRQIEGKLDTEFYSRLTRLREERRNQVRRQQRFNMVLSALSPAGAFNFASMDLAGTGFVQQERIEDALDNHLTYMARFIREKEYQWKDRTLTDFSPFIYQESEALKECLSRNTVHFLNLGLLAVLGFAGAYVAILKYDVR